MPTRVQQPPHAMTLLLCFVFFLSGIAALLFETLWFYQTGLLLGNTVWSSSIVLASFMGGLALGYLLVGHLGHRIRRPIRWYGLLELLIGATGLLLVVALPKIIPWLVPLFSVIDAPGLLNVVRVVVAFPLLLVPSTAMGVTLPLLVGVLYRRDPRFGAALGRLYGWNTLGAVCGAVLAEAALIEWLGIQGTGVVAACLNGLAAILAFSYLMPLEEAQASGFHALAKPTARSDRAWALLAAAFVLGATLLALEVIWFRFLMYFMLANSLAFATILGVVLAGIGMGGLAASAWLRARPQAHRLLPQIACISGCLCVFSYMALDPIAAAFSSRPATRWTEVLLYGIPLMFPVSFLSGMLFTFLGESLNREITSETRAAGFLTVANTIGAMVGSLVAGFFLLPGLGIEASLRLLAGAY